MIRRYSREAMQRIWSDENRYQKWLDVEIAACEGWASLGRIPEKSLENIRKKARFTVERIEEIEAVTRHDVIAFVSCVAEYVGEDARFIHMGMTSSDVLDTALALQLKESGELIITGIRDLMDVLKRRAFEFKHTPAMGRSHGIHAEPISFGLKFALWYAEMARNLKRMEDAVETVSYGKISGAVGTFANIPPEVEEYACRMLGLKPAPISTQIIQRDRHAQFFSTIAVVGSTLEKIATEIRHLQKTEVLEAMEPFGKGQKGSSAMPHKKNPILSENITGLARLLRGYCLSSLENVALWHERDISHSSVERVIAPDATIVLDFALARLAGVIGGLVVYPENMQRNIDLTRGLWHSQGVLLALVDRGIARDTAYQWVQRNALKVWENKGDFKSLLLGDEDIVRTLGADSIENLFDLSHHLRYVDHIFERVFP
ncbi:MAG: Adenylosuccinate lyase [Deltaproteobacteria bacterium ADurb.BinA179]|nr:adenylosuccinate lyase [Bacteriovoracaceae bacterium]OPZ30195.1 MAG: Adenylosuccinate lyase [Deltaproteobacteria bacterium ADurb.BinA179]HNR50256.1 adenylosuccinate lyase [Deltaproteobacteria bacterium]HOD71573.1 adenylosuccinate lyase [Deltaproteobacteria bacterium]HOS26495.1 adenylosuccinate lyase [Deltaproteobacteria bacterium]